ncbi:Lacal_2735 family protein [Zunongwangia sp.]|uniref:Lacal_2735 family protein n=1 Tax=Zunongwangia sp. TaxID=1965325 RepID=UPI003AA7CCBC
MFKIFKKKSKEECMCQKYTYLMHKAYKLALIDKEKSDRMNQRAKKILKELRRMHYSEVENWSTDSK